jgi:hypothetical protein
MLSLGIFLAGFTSGWVARSTVDSSRGAAVKLIAAAMGAADRVKRAVALEREHIEDLVAEARSQFEAQRARRVAVPVDVHAVNDRAA